MKRVRQLAVAGSKLLTRAPLEEALLTELSGLDLGRVLFVGSGGRMEALFRQTTHDTFTTIDVDESRNPDEVMSVTEMRFPAESFDTAILAEVLEHVQEPWKVNSEVGSVLSAAGRLILTTPFLFPLHDEPHDYYRYTSFGLEILFPSFRIVNLKYRAGFLSTQVAVGSRLVRQRGLSFFFGLNFVLFGILFQPLLRVIDRSLPDLAPLGYILHLQKTVK